MGRKRKAGPRGKTGRLQGWNMRDYGNAVAQARRALYDCMAIRGGKAADQIHDGIGRLWALDFLDGYHIDPDVMRDTARRYAELYWIRNADKAPKVGQAERVGFSLPSLEDTRGDLLLERWMDILPAGERKVLEKAVTEHWHSDKEADFIERLVGVELMNRGRMTFANPTQPGDRGLLDTLIDALLTISGGAVRRLAA